MIKFTTEYLFGPMFYDFSETMRRGDHQKDGNTDNAQEKEDPEDPSRRIAKKILNFTPWKSPTMRPLSIACRNFAERMVGHHLIFGIDRPDVKQLAIKKAVRIEGGAVCYISE